jgi:hypothetical protein
MFIVGVSENQVTHSVSWIIISTLQNSLTGQKICTFALAGGALKVNPSLLMNQLSR